VAWVWTNLMLWGEGSLHSPKQQSEHAGNKPNCVARYTRNTRGTN